MTQFRALLASLQQAGVQFVVVGGVAGVLHDVPLVTFDLDIVHCRSVDNIARLLAWLRDHNAYVRNDPRKMIPNETHLSGSGHLNLTTNFGSLDILCELELGVGYEQLLADTTDIDGVHVLTLERLITVKSATGRPKDRAVLPLLLATLDERDRKS